MGLVTAFVLGYLIGNLSPATIIVRLFKQDDIRKYGSGNPGATNVNRILGIRWAVVTLFLDAFKGIAAILVGRWIGDLLGGSIGGVSGWELGGLIGALGGIVGHNWPLFMGFKGGKGVATTAGIALFLFPIPSLIIAAIFFTVVGVTRYVSLGSVLIGILLPTMLLIFRDPIQEFLLALALGVLILLRHRGNIQRLLKGEERRITFSSKPTQEKASEGEVSSEGKE